MPLLGPVSIYPFGFCISRGEDIIDEKTATRRFLSAVKYCRHRGQQGLIMIMQLP